MRCCCAMHRIALTFTSLAQGTHRLDSIHSQESLTLVTLVALSNGRKCYIIDHAVDLRLAPIQSAGNDCLTLTALAEQCLSRTVLFCCMMPCMIYQRSDNHSTQSQWFFTQNHCSLWHIEDCSIGSLGKPRLSPNTHFLFVLKLIIFIYKHSKGLWVLAHCSCAVDSIVLKVVQHGLISLSKQSINVSHSCHKTCPFAVTEEQS